MSPRHLAVDVLVALGVGGELVCCLGLVLARDAFDRLHYAAAATSVPAFLVLAATLVREHVTVGGLEAIAAVGLLFLLNPAVVLATAMATRRIDEGEKT